MLRLVECLIWLICITLLPRGAAFSFSNSTLNTTTSAISSVTSTETTRGSSTSTSSTSPQASHGLGFYINQGLGIDSSSGKLSGASLNAASTTLKQAQGQISKSSGVSSNTSTIPLGTATTLQSIIKVIISSTNATTTAKGTAVTAAHVQHNGFQSSSLRVNTTTSEYLTTGGLKLSNASSLSICPQLSLATWTPPVIGGVQNSSEWVASCQAAGHEWHSALMNFRSAVAINASDTYSTYVTTATSHYAVADTAGVYTLCDGYPRLNASTYKTAHLYDIPVTSTTSSQIITAPYQSSCVFDGTSPTFSAPEPCGCTAPCMPISACISLWEEWSRKYGSLGEFNTLTPYACPLGSGVNCFTTFAGINGGETNTGLWCGSSYPTNTANMPCTIGANSVQVFYWPPSTRGGDFCTSGKTITANNGTRYATYSVAPNSTITFTSPSIYLSLPTVSATSAFVGGFGGGQWNDEYVGRVYTDVIVSMDPSAVSSVVGHIPGFQGSWQAELQEIFSNSAVNISLTEEPYDWAHMTAPYPASAYFFGHATSWLKNLYSDQQGFFVPSGQYINTIYDNWRPTMSVPTELRDLDPAWSTCLPYLGGVYDPPSALTPAATAGSITLPNQPAQSTSAAPSKTAAPAPGPTSSAPDPPAPTSSNAIAQPQASSNAPGNQTPSNAASTPATNPDNTVQDPSPAQSTSAAADPQPSNVSPAQNTPNAQSSAAANNGDPGNLISAIASAAAQMTTNADPDSSAASPNGASAPAVSNGQPAGASVATAVVNGNTIVISGTPNAAVTQSGIQPVQSQAAASPAPASSSAAVFSIGSSAVIAVPTAVTNANGNASPAAVVGGQTIIQGGDPVTVGSQVVSLGSSGVVVDGTASHGFSAAPAPSAAPVAVLALGQSTLKAVQTVVTGNDGALITQAVVEGQTVQAGGPAATVAGHTVSLGSAGVIVDGQQTQAFLVPAGSAPSSVAAINLGSTTLAASQAIGTGSNGQLTTQAVIDGTTIEAGDPAVTIAGHAISVGSSGVIVDGQPTQALSAQDPAQSGPVINLGSSTLTASQAVITGANGQLTTAAVVDGTTLILGGTPITIGSHTVSAGSNGLIVDGSSTIAISALPTNSPGATAITLGSTTFQVSQIITTDSAGHTITAAFVDGTTLTAGQAATLDGHTISLASSGGLIIDGSSTAQLPTALSSALITVNPSLTLTATPTYITGTDGKPIEEAVVGGKTLTAGGGAETINGQVVSLNTDGVLVVNSTSTNLFSHSATSGTSKTTTSSLSSLGGTQSSVRPTAATTSKKSTGAKNMVCTSLALLMVCILMLCY